jgi:hypothetical protein
MEVASSLEKEVSMRRFGAAALALCGAGLASLAGGPAFAQQFSADMISSGGGSHAPSKLYVANGKIRMEPAGGKGSIIIDSAAGTAVVLVPAQKLVIDAKQMGASSRFMAPLDPDNPCPQWEKIAHDADPSEGGAWTCKRIGPETVNGRATVKFEATSPKGEQDFGWIDRRLKFVVKSQSAKGEGMELQNIQEGAQPASLFEIPADYQKTDMKEMMQRMMNQRSNGARGGGGGGN